MKLEHTILVHSGRRHDGGNFWKGPSLVYGVAKGPCQEGLCILNSYCIYVSICFAQTPLSHKLKAKVFYCT